MMWNTLNFAVLSCLALGIVADSSNTLVENGSKDNSDECECYLTSGPDPGYFQYYRFFDFRNVPNDGDNDYTVAPPLITTLENQGGQNVTSPFLNTTDFQANWSIQDDVARPDSPVPGVNSAQNVYISRNSTAGAESSTHLTLRASRLPDFMSIAEIDSNQANLLHSSIRARLRFISNGMSNSSAPTDGSEPLNDAATGSNSSHPVDPGAVLGLFTYYSDTEESDIEILSRDPIDQIRYSNQPDYNSKTDTDIPGASTIVTMPDSLVWTDWLDHRIDWFQGVSRWYINDELLLNKTMNVPTSPSGMIINLWGDGGEWSGNMSVGAQVTVAVEWIEMAFNISGNVEGPGHRRRRDEVEKRSNQKICHVGCNVDGIKQVGYPELAFNTTGMDSGAFSWVRQGHGYGWTFYAALFVAMTLLFT